MPDPSAALRALSMIRGGAGSPVSLARRAILGPQVTFTDPDQEYLDALDEADWEGMGIPGDPYPERPFDPGDEGRAAAIDRYNRGPKPGADMRGTMPSMDAEPDPYDPGEAYEMESDMPGPDLREEDVRPDFTSGIRSAGPSGNARGAGPAYDAYQQRSNQFIPRAPRNAAEAVDSLGPVFAQLGRGSAYTGAPSVTTAPMGERYQAAGQAPAVGGIDEELEAQKRRLLAGGY